MPLMRLNASVKTMTAKYRIRKRSYLQILVLVRNGESSTRSVWRLILESRFNTRTGDFDLIQIHIFCLSV